ncbi:J domain-containing protein [Galactobacter sp.]|uniref:J domain-containing protein n=1 Tax=Galactobacter sp. TaxID=2676125 RepID=UPI0025BA8B2A|nr:J domain-containing protein [Galactobacter sp.]
MSEDHYRVLGLAPDADDEQIRKAFRSLSRRHHPDLGGDAETYRAVTVAYTVLSDAEQRRRYDARRGAATGPSARPAGAGHTSSGTAAPQSPPSASSARRPPSASVPRRKPVRLTGSVPGVDPGPLVRGSVPKRGFLDRTRAVRETVVSNLSAAVARDLPATRAVLGTDLPGNGEHDAVLSAGRRLVIVDVVMSRDSPHGWDGTSLRMDGKRRAVPDVARAAAELERKVRGSRAIGLVVVASSPQDIHRPVVESYTRSTTQPAPANPAGARREIVTFLAGGADSDAVDLGVLADLTALT